LPWRSRPWRSRGLLVLLVRGLPFLADPAELRPAAEHAQLLAIEDEIGIAPAPLVMLVPASTPLPVLARGSAQLVRDPDLGVRFVDGPHRDVPDAETEARVQACRAAMHGFAAAALQELAAQGSLRNGSALDWRSSKRCCSPIQNLRTRAPYSSSPARSGTCSAASCSTRCAIGPASSRSPRTRGRHSAGWWRCSVRCASSKSCAARSPPTSAMPWSSPRSRPSR
jgi:hypothetical protein